MQTCGTYFAGLASLAFVLWCSRSWLSQTVSTSCRLWEVLLSLLVSSLLQDQFAFYRLEVSVAVVAFAGASVEAWSPAQRPTVDVNVSEATVVRQGSSFDPNAPCERPLWHLVDCEGRADSGDLTSGRRPKW